MFERSGAIVGGAERLARAGHVLWIEQRQDAVERVVGRRRLVDGLVEQRARHKLSSVVAGRRLPIHAKCLDLPVRRRRVEDR